MDSETFNAIYGSNDERQKRIEEHDEETEFQERQAIEEQEKPKGPKSALPEGHPFRKHEGELGRAVVGGVTDIYNSVASLPKLFDKRFWQPDDPNDPYKYESPLLINKTPIMRTQWGKFVRGGTELVGGLVGTGKVMWGMKGLKGVSTAARATRAGRIGLSAVQGATYDVISNQSQEANLARTLIDIKPQWAGILDPIATREDMSPAMRSMYNIGEGLGIGAFFDIAVEGGGWGLRAFSKEAKKAAKKAIGTDPLIKAIDDSSDADYAVKTWQVEKGARSAYEKAQHRKFNKTLPEGTDKIPLREWRKTNKPWDKLDKKQKNDLMELYAEKADMDWGEYRDMSRRQYKQGQAATELQAEQLEFDLKSGVPRENPAYYKGGDITDNQPLSSSSKPVKGVRDMIEIRNNPTQKYGSPRGTLQEADIRRFEYKNPGTISRSRDILAKKLEASPAYQKLYGDKSAAAIEIDLVEAANDLNSFISESGHSRLVDLPEENLIKYIRSKDPVNELISNSDFSSGVDGLGVLNKSQLVATDTILGQLLFESRDLAKAALSVSGEIDVKAQGSLLDGIMARYNAIARLKKETSMLADFQIRKQRAGGKLKDTLDEQLIRGSASDAASEEVKTFKHLLQNDLDDDLLESFIHFTAVGNGKKQTWKDLNKFFTRKLQGYRGKDGYQRNAILNELQTMGINSMLSGPKTPMRALVGTGIGTIMRPVATILGSIGKADDSTFRGAMANVGGMIEARNEAWRKAVADWQSYSVNEDGWRGFIQNKADTEWNAMMNYTKYNGTMGAKAQAHIADNLRELNKNPWLNYGPRVMKSMDVYFSQIIGRGRLRQLAFNDVYKSMNDQGLSMSDEALSKLVKDAEIDFQTKVFDADGQITDEMAKFAADEAKLTKELQGWAKDFDEVFDKLPFVRPFFLFARTGINALEMTSKYTPIVNSFIGEHVDIMTKSWDAPEMLQYGIKSADDLELAKATMRGRMAIGYGVTATASWMALNGQITGNGPPDRGLRNSWLQQGWQPRSIKIGDKYVSYEALEPFNGMLSFVADVVDAQGVMGEQWVSNELGKVSYLLSANVVNKTFLSGLVQLQDLITSQGADYPRVAANFVNNQIPLGGMRNEIGKLLSPGMRELETGFFQSVGNRNLWVDIVQNGEILPYRYDILNGEKLKDYDPLTRLWNAISPFTINIGTNETRAWLMRSGINLKQTFNTGPEGQSLEGQPVLKSKFQFYMGQQNIEAKLEKIMSHPEIKDSILRMEEAHKSGRHYDAVHTAHAEIIEEVFYSAKSNAWKMLMSDPGYEEEAIKLERLHQLGRLRVKQLKGANYNKALKTEKQIEIIQNIRK